MTITPDGYPAWVRANSHETYGGHAEKRNYQQQGVTNPLTDIGAEQYTRMAEDVAQCQRTGSFAVISFVCDDSTPAAPTVNVLMMSGLASASYIGSSPPTGFPAVARNSDGNFTVTFSSTATDAYGVSAAVNIAAVIASVSGGLASWTRDNAYTVTVACVDTSAAALANASGTLELY